MVENVHNIIETVVSAVNLRCHLPIDLIARMEPDVPQRPELQQMLTC